MSKEKFHNVLTGAVAGSHKDVGQILVLYKEKSGAFFEIFY